MPEDKKNNKLNFTPQEEPIPMPDESKRFLESILMELNRGVKAFHIYPEGHPSLKAFLENTFNKVKRLLESFEESHDVVISIERNSFYDIKGGELDSEKIADLANEFFHRRIKRLTISKEITPKGWMGLIKLINTEPKEILDIGGAEKFVVQQKIMGIQVNEIRYEDIVDMVTELGKEKDGEIDQEGEGGGGSEGDTEGSEEMKEGSVPIAHAATFKGEEPVHKQNDLDRLIDLLEKEKDSTRYREIVKNLVRKAAILRENKEMDDFIRILYLFSKHSAPDSLRPKEQQDTSYMAIKNLFDPYTSDILIELLCIGEEDKIGEIKNIVLRIGGEMIPYLLDSLIEREGMHARRNLYNLIVEFGESARDDIEARLEDDRWFAVRQMVSLLGTIGNPKSFEALRKALEYPDIRVKKEVVKALAMLKTRESIQELINILTSKKPSPLSLQVIVSVGVIKVSDAVPTLIDFIEKIDIWGSNYELKKEAISALGNIGDTRAVPVLSNILKKKKRLWRRLAHRKLRSLAAISLGKIGGEKVTDILQDTMKNSKGPVYQSCINALKGLKATGANV